MTALAHQREELERRERRITELDMVGDSLCSRIVARERELERIRVELELARAEDAGAPGAAVAIDGELEAMRRQARGQATRIRLGALREAADLSRRITELTQRPAESRERLLRAINDAIGRIGADPAELVSAASNGAADAAQPSDALPRAEGEMFDGRVELEVGPLADFSQLVGFEDAAGEIAATSQISVKRFTKGRATLELSLAEPVELLRELEERAPFEFRVRDQRDGRVVLDLGDE